jgi:hypothetical protein
MAGDTDIDDAYIPFDDDLEDYLPYEPSLQLRKRVHAERTMYSRRGKSLIHLLENSQNKECSVPRDRIFSLLALCSPKSRIKVDYNSAPKELAMDMLRKRSCCICSTHIVARALDIQHSVRDGAASRPFAYVTLPVLHYAAQPAHVHPYSHVACHPSLTTRSSKMTVTINLFETCCASRGRIVFDIDTSASLLFNVVTSSITYSSGFSHRPALLGKELLFLISDCTSFVHGKRFTLYMSFDALLRLASLAHDLVNGDVRQCCPRARDASASADAWYTPRVPLRLCPDD